MEYLLKKINIETKNYEYIIYNNWKLDLQNSTIKTGIIDKLYKKKIHIIYTGIINKEKIDINFNSIIEEQNILITIKLINKIDSYINLNINNLSKNSSIECNIFIYNNSNIKLNIIGNNKKENTKVYINTKIYTNSKTNTLLFGTAIIDKNIKNCESNINFSALAHPLSKIEFIPNQKINSIPEKADHSAFLYKGSKQQILFLKENGLSEKKIDKILKQAFINSN